MEVKRMDMGRKNSLGQKMGIDLMDGGKEDGWE